jgi:hypothetical protein
MKSIKAYLESRKEVYTVLWIQEQQKENLDLLKVKYYLDKVILFSEELQLLKEKK